MLHNVINYHYVSIALAIIIGVDLQGYKVGPHCVLGQLLCLAYVNDIWRDIETKIRLFADDCIIYRKILNVKDVEI